MNKKFHFPDVVFCSNAFWFFTITFFFATISSRARDVQPQDTTGPNQFYFTSDVYFVDKRATNAAIPVEFVPGNRGWSGSVDFFTTNGTAQAGIDYQPTNGTLNFSGPGTPIPVIEVPVLNNTASETNVTVELYLSNTSAVIPRAHATLVIIDTNQPPALKMSHNEYGVILSWPAIYSGYNVEKAVDISAENWNKIEATPATYNGFASVSDGFSEGPAFYRLRKDAAP